jgi:hypothetical protein
MASIDFDEVRKRCCLHEVMRAFGWIGNLCHPNSPRGPCPLNCSPDVRCCSFNWSRNLWYCHRCHQGGGVIALVTQTRGLNAFEAAKLICTAINVTVPWQERSKVRRPRQPRERRKKACGPTEEDVDSY